MAYAFWQGQGAQWVRIAGWAAMATFLGALLSLTNSILYAREAMGYETVAKVLRAVMALVLGYIGVQMGLSFPTILALLAAATAIQLLLSAHFVKRVMTGFPLRAIDCRASRQLAKELLRRSLPFLALWIVGVLYASMNIILLRNLGLDLSEVGYYASAQRIFAMLGIFPAMLFQAIFPAFSRLHSDDYPKMQKAFERAYSYVLLISFPMAIGLSLVAPHVIVFIFGEEFVDGGRILQILGLSLLNGVGHVLSAALLAMHRQRIHAIISSISLVLVGTLAWWAIPKWGAVGAAWAYNFGTLTGFIVYSTLVFHWLHVRFPFVWTGKVIVASAVMGVFTWFLLQYVNFLIVSFVISPAVYLLTLVSFRIFSQEDKRALVRMMPGLIANRLLPPDETIQYQETGR